MTIMQNKIPEVPLINLTTLWFQISGTLCNLQCSHCFISCGPDVARHRIMSRDTVNTYLKETKKYGVKEFYLTGGEPFLNPQLFDIVEDVLVIGNVTILTNATIITTEAALQLKQLSDNFSGELIFRVSIESPVEEENDSIRGQDSFTKAVEGIKNLFVAGFNPIITTTTLKEGCDVPEERFNEWMCGLGAVKPQFKTLPTIYLGRAQENLRPYRNDERVTENCFIDFPKSNLPCSYCRMITSEGVYVCPILIDNPKARLGSSLGESLTSYAMESNACYTCRTAGLCCSNTMVTR